MLAVSISGLLVFCVPKCQLLVSRSLKGSFKYKLVLLYWFMQIKKNLPSIVQE